VPRLLARTAVEGGKGYAKVRSTYMRTGSPGLVLRPDSVEEVVEAPATAGGIGFLARRYGLTIDQVVAAEVVLADGSVVRADAGEHPDLFWGIRGASANFGIVTASFETDPMPERLHDAFPAETLERLRRLKAQYDRGNVFDQNFAIDPEHLFA
jgi:FAD/FMN-containing dehydrogenase